MRSILVVAVAVLSLAACSSSGDPSFTSPTGDPAATAGATPTAGASGEPAEGVLPSGSAADKATCEAITTKLSEWGLAFANAAGGLADAGNDTAKVEAVVKQAKAANTKFAGELRTLAGKTGDAKVKKVASDLAAALEKINGQLDAKEIAKDPGKLTEAFDMPEYAAAADGYEKVCGG